MTWSTSNSSNIDIRGVTTDANTIITYSEMCKFKSADIVII